MVRSCTDKLAWDSTSKLACKKCTALLLPLTARKSEPQGVLHTFGWHYLSNATGPTQDSSQLANSVAIYDGWSLTRPDTHTTNSELSRIGQVALDKQCHPLHGERLQQKARPSPARRLLLLLEGELCHEPRRRSGHQAVAMHASHGRRRWLDDSITL